MEFSTDRNISCEIFFLSHNLYAFTYIVNRLVTEIGDIIKHVFTKVYPLKSKIVRHSGVLQFLDGIEKHV